MTSPPSSRSAVATMRETLESLRRRAPHPMKSWDSGRVIDAHAVEDDARTARPARSLAPAGAGCGVTLRPLGLSRR